ncbi:MAG: Lrp/AsnC family transcriptional regulator [Thiolinea sp.]
MTSSINQQDRRILQRLQKNCRQPIADIGEQIGMSTSACHRRIKQLEENGLIRNYVAQLDARKLGYAMDVMVEISLISQSDDALTRFEAAIAQAPEILECHLMAGDADYLLRFMATGLEDYERLHREVVSRLPGISRVKSNIILRTVKRAQGLNI